MGKVIYTKSNITEREITLSDVKELYWILSDEEIINTLLSGYTERKILMLKWHDLMTLKEISDEIGLSQTRTSQLYRRTVRRIKSRVKNFIIAYKQFAALVEENGVLKAQNDLYKRRYDELSDADKAKLGSAQVLTLKLSELGFSVRCSNVFKALNLITVEDLWQFSEKELLRIRNLGSGSVKEIKSVFSSLGLNLK